MRPFCCSLAKRRDRPYAKHMLVSRWIPEAQKAGWRVSSSRNGVLTMVCSHLGCPGALSLPMNNLGPTPAPCDQPHVGQYGEMTYDRYKGLVNELKRKRRALGLSQEEINAAAGLGDGHINKLEALHRTAQFPTLQLWAATVGLEITVKPAPLPPATARAIERKPAPLRESAKQRALFDG